MGTGILGTFVISWSQTETDGLASAPVSMMTVGATWRWTGRAVRVDGVQDVLVLNGAEGAAEIRERAARVAGRLIGQAQAGPRKKAPARGQDPLEHGFVVTDGTRSFAATVIEPRRGAALLVMFEGQMPPANAELWVVRVAGNLGLSAVTETGGMICFTPNTSIRTADGARLIQELRLGDRIVTKDNGLQAIKWIGHRRIATGQLHAMPQLRPIRFRAGALGVGRPDGDLLVSPQHRMVITGPAALALFNAAEVLVTAEDLVNGTSIHVDLTPRDAVYIHIMLEQHQIIWANGLETESFHPASAALERIEAAQRASLFGLVPGVQEDPYKYGAYARRNLSPAEAAILQSDLAA
jgi:hypothetical protein